MSQTRRAESKNPLDLMAFKFIRMIMGCYFIALSVNVIQGVDTSVFFAPFMDAQIADRISKGVVLYCASLMFFGIFLRSVSLYLAIMVLTSSVMHNFLQPGGNVDQFWHDIVLVCCLLLTYCTLTPRDLRRQAFLLSYLPIPKLGALKTVYPRRVTTAKGQNTRPKVDVPKMGTYGYGAEQPSMPEHSRVTPVLDEQDDLLGAIRTITQRPESQKSEADCDTDPVRNIFHMRSGVN